MMLGVNKAKGKQAYTICKFPVTIAVDGVVDKISGNLNCDENEDNDARV